MSPLWGYRKSHNQATKGFGTVRGTTIPNEFMLRCRPMKWTDEKEMAGMKRNHTVYSDELLAVSKLFYLMEAAIMICCCSVCF